jgi:serine/threonine protein phosphatase PrpC
MFEEEGYGMVVADGMGGAAGGEVASSLAIRTLLNLIFDTPDWIISSDQHHAEQVMQRMAERFRQIDERLIEKADGEPALRGMGTTMTLACNVGDSMILAHIGDSRAYLYRAGMLHQLTHDHTVAQALVDNGILTRADLACVRLQHALIRVLGGNGHQCEADMQRLLLLNGDVIVLCTDGLTDMVNDADIAAILGKNAAVSDSCHALVERALHNGGKDNVTAIVARYGFFDRSPSPSA